MAEPLVLGGREIAAGTRLTVEIPVARRTTHGEVVLPVEVVRGRRAGPSLFVSAAVHGDEIAGTEIVRRLLRMPILRRIRGTLLAVPIVNAFGFVAHSRYLPDRRDLNRCFPGSPSGSLAARLAHLFMTEVVANATHGIDLHTGAIHRSNLPQIRAGLDDPETARLARAFGAPVILDASLRDGSLRQAVHERGVPMLLYEAGEALRFDEVAIRAGQRGVLSVMRALGMLRPRRREVGRRRADAAAEAEARSFEPFVARGSTWVRAPQGGMLRTSVRLGARVAAGERLGTIGDPLGQTQVEVLAPLDGVVIGRTELPLVNEGDALFHVGLFKRLQSVVEQLEAFQEEMRPSDQA